MKKIDFSNPFANDLADFKSVAKSLRSAQSTEILNASPVSSPSPLLHTAPVSHSGETWGGGARQVSTSQMDITLEGQPIGRRGRRQPPQSSPQPSHDAVFPSSPLGTPGNGNHPRGWSAAGGTGSSLHPGHSAPLHHQHTLSIVSTPALHGVSSIDPPRHDDGGADWSPSQHRDVLFPTGLHLSSTDTSGFPIGSSAAGTGKAVPLPFGHPQAAPASQHTAPPQLASSVGWLNDEPSFLQPHEWGAAGSAAESVGQRSVVHIDHRGTVPLSKNDSNIGKPQPQGTFGVPSFLDDSYDHPEMGGPSDASMPYPAAVNQPPPVSPAEMELKKLKDEQNDLLSELDATETEIEVTEKKMDLQQIKDETELLELDTTLLNKKAEIRRMEAEAKAKREESIQSGENRLEAMKDKQKKELEDLREEVETSEQMKYAARLKRVQDQYNELRTVVDTLKEQQALFRFRHPYDTRSILSVLNDDRVTRGSSPPSLAAHPSVPGEESIMTKPIEEQLVVGSLSPPAAAADGAKEQNQNGSAVHDTTRLTPQSRVDGLLDRGISVLMEYCNTRCESLRKNIVDYIHTSTLEAAQAVRKARESAWIYESMERKRLLSEHIQSSLQRYMIFFRERAELKERNIKRVQKMVEELCIKFQNEMRDRHNQICISMEAKWNIESSNHEKETQIRAVEQTEQHQRIIAMDQSLASTQIGEAEARYQTESQVRKNLFSLEERGLADQLEKLRTARNGASELIQVQEEARKSLHEGMKKLREHLSSQKERIHRQLLLPNTRNDAVPTLVSDDLSLPPLPFTPAARSQASTCNMKVEELCHVLVVSEQALREEQVACQAKTQRCHELLLQIPPSVLNVVEVMQKRRSAQKAQESRLDRLRSTWEMEHQEALESPYSIRVTQMAVGSLLGEANGNPVMKGDGNTLSSSPSVISAGGSTRQVRTDPWRVAVASAAEAVVAGLTLRRRLGEQLSSLRRQLFQSPMELIQFIRQQQRKVERGWCALLDCTLETQRALDEKAREDGRLTALEEVVALEKPQLELEMEEHAIEKKRMTQLWCDGEEGKRQQNRDLRIPAAVSPYRMEYGDQDPMSRHSVRFAKS